MRVLLLEDHAALREMIGDHLAQRGFAVTCSPSVLQWE
jgi:DNA-binding response OmpR family regulator